MPDEIMSMIESFLTKKARSCLLRDGWFPGRTCSVSELEQLHRQLFIGNGHPPCKLILEFVEEFGGLELHRPYGWELALSPWYLPYYRPQTFVQHANFKPYTTISTTDLHDV